MKINSPSECLLELVAQGMDVHDVDGEHLGIVRSVCLGAKPGCVPPPNKDRLPTELAERLRQEGYVKIDWNELFAADRYALPNQIAIVDNAVRLKVRGYHLAYR